AVGRARVARCALEGVLAQDAERYFIGDGLADECRAGVEQGLHGPCMPGRQRILPRPVGVAATRGITGDVEQILCRKSKAGKRAAGPAFDAYTWSRHEGVDRVGHSPSSALGAEHCK